MAVEQSCPSVSMRDVSDASDYDVNEDEWLDEAESSDDGHESTEEDIVAPGPSTSTGRNNLGYNVLTTQEVETNQAEAINQVCELLHCSNTVARSILIHYRWNAERVMSTAVDKDFDYVYKQVGLPAPSDPVEPRPNGAIMCAICCDDVLVDQCPSMLCGHVFCGSCWRQHFKTGIDEGKARQLRCMAHKCGTPCDEVVVTSLLANDPTYLKKFQEALSTSYIDDNSMACFCPSAPWCGRAIVVTGDPVCEPECTCGQSFCFKCMRETHSPCTCDMWTKWEEKTQGDSETRNWLQANTKPCPKCNKPVEKNGGCNHVTCKCGQSFCWLCGQATGMAHTWNNIQGHSCGRYKEEYDKKINDAAASHKRYMHYFERYKGHQDSYKKECEKRAGLLKSIAEQLSSQLEERDTDWLVTALEQLKVARRVLAPSYVFAYFTFGDMFLDEWPEDKLKRYQNLFEDQQQMLETEVERLSNLTTNASTEIMHRTKMPDDSTRISTINSTNNIERRIFKFYEMIQDVLDQLQTAASIAPFAPRKPGSR